MPDPVKKVEEDMSLSDCMCHKLALMHSSGSKVVGTPENTPLSPVAHTCLTAPNELKLVTHCH